jgi:hypothetical protein
MYPLLCISSKAYPIVSTSNKIVFSLMNFAGRLVTLFSKSSYSVNKPALPA